LAAERGIEVEGRAGETVYVAAIDDGDWVGYSQVDFRGGTTSLVLRVASESGGGSIDVRVDGCVTDAEGTSIAACAMRATGGRDTHAVVPCALTGTSGPHAPCLVFSGAAGLRFDAWHLG